MVIEEASGYCLHCKKQVLVRRKGTNHILHLLLTIIFGLLTGGIGAIVWIIVWILASIRIGGWRCSQCGTKTKHSETPLTDEQRQKRRRAAAYVAVPLLALVGFVMLVEQITERSHGPGMTIDEKNAREAELLAEARKVPASDARRNRLIYQELMAINPDNPLYQSKFQHYLDAENQ